MSASGTQGQEPYARALAALVLLMVGGCHLLVPYEGHGDAGRIDVSGDSHQDFRVTDARPEQGGDGPRDRGAETGDAAVDTCTPVPDLGPPDQGAPAGDGSAGPTKPCIDSEANLLAQCKGPCLPADDVDCDGLEAGGAGAAVQDPWPKERNPLRFADGFNDDPLAKRWSAGSKSCSFNTGLTWDSVKKTLVAKGCPVLTLSASCAAALKDPDYMVEVRFSVDKILKPFNWDVYIYFGSSPWDRYCRLAHHSGVAGGEPHVQIYSGSGQMVGMPGLKPLSTFLLQGYSFIDLKTGKRWHHCRLLSGDGKQELGTAPVVASVTKPQPIKISTSNVEATIDHVRVYEVFDQAP